MSTVFDTIATKSLPESVFDLSREWKGSLNMGEIIPIYLEDILPGDTFKVKSEILIRLAPMLAPVMHRVNVTTHYFYVPNRLIWTNFHDHISGGEDGLSNPGHPVLQIQEANKNAFVAGTLADYLGVPAVDPNATITESTPISALPHRAYGLIYNEYYRDQDLSEKVTVALTDGLDNTTNQQIQTRAWEKDYFTSARPKSQKGDPIALPINANVTYKTTATATATGNPGALTVIQNDQIAAAGVSTGIDNIESVTGSLGIEDLRRSSKIQEWLELAQRGGSRINEIIKNFFGVTPDDLRLTRPQYLGGGRAPVVMSEVLNTAGDTGTTLQPLGEYGGHGISIGNQNGFQNKFKEHGYVMGLMSVTPKTNYSQGIPRHFRKFDKYEKYWPQFENWGEQEIKNHEIYTDYADTRVNNDSVFGYQQRYSEYKYGVSTIHGDFRKDSTGDKLSYWHMGQYFENRPLLNDEFVKSNPTHRIFAVTDESVHKLYVQIYHKVKAKRKMSYHTVPSLI